MIIEPNEFFLRNQALLFQLAQILIPLSEQVARKVPTLSQHLFVPPSLKEENSLRHSTRTLKVLGQIEGDVRKLIDSIESEPLDRASKETIKNPSQNQSRETKKDQTPPQAKNLDQNRILIDQVRVAMQTLYSIPATESSKGFRDFLKKLKPTLDSLIDLVGRSEMTAASDNETFSSDKKVKDFPSLKPSQTKKNFLFPHAGERESEKSEKIRSSVSVQVQPARAQKPTRSESLSSHSAPKKTSPVYQKEKGNEKPQLASEHHDGRLKTKELSEKSTFPSAQKQLTIHGLRKKESAVESEQESRPGPRLDRPTPTSIPFPTQLVPATRHPKRKRKTFWFRDEEGEEDEEESGRRPRT